MKINKRCVPFIHLSILVLFSAILALTYIWVTGHFALRSRVIAKAAEQSTSQTTFPKGRGPDFRIEKFTGVRCAVDSQCSTPPEYMVRSSCPFSSKCVDNGCAVICPLPTALATSSADTDWKTYRNEKYGFEFKYPSAYQVKEYTKPVVYFTVSNASSTLAKLNINIRTEDLSTSTARLLVQKIKQMGDREFIYEELQYDYPLVRVSGTMLSNLYEFTALTNSPELARRLINSFVVREAWLSEKDIPLEEDQGKMIFYFTDNIARASKQDPELSGPTSVFITMPSGIVCDGHGNLVSKISALTRPIYLASPCPEGNFMSFGYEQTFAPDFTKKYTLTIIPEINGVYDFEFGPFIYPSPSIGQGYKAVFEFDGKALSSSDSNSAFRVPALHIDFEGDGKFDYDQYPYVIN